VIEVLVAILGLGVGDYADPLDLNLEDKDKKECTTYTKTVKEYNFEINDYIESEVSEEKCNWKPQDRQ